MIKKARKDFNTFKDLQVAVLGLTFKPGTDDLREAPSIPNIRLLLNEGAKVSAFDPVGMDNFKKIFPNEVKYKSSIEETLDGADVCFIFTEWQEIKEMNLELFTEK